MKPLFLLSAMLCLFSGCQFYRNVVVGENGKVLPWREHRDDPEAQARWNERHAQWQIEDAHRRYDAGLMDRYRYNQIRQEQGLQPIR
ncbi:MAG: hypothetical protein ACPGQC_09305 [Limisphaerales bacterium]